jgi:Holliday junction resolvase
MFMTNSNYRRGADKERALVRAAKDAGLIAMRSAGSKGKIDVLIIDPTARTVRLIQCKPDDYPASKVRALELEMAPISGTYSLTFEVK